MDMPGVSSRQVIITQAYLAEDRSGQLVRISIAFAVLTTMILALRLYAKRFQGGGIYADDYFLISAYVVNLGMCAIGIVMTKVGGVGRHVQFVKQTNPAALTRWAQCVLAFEFIYFTSVALTKMAILLLYMRIFNWRGAMLAATWAVFALTAATSASLIVAAGLQCTPIAFWWDRTIPGGRCFNVQAFFHAQALPGFILDLIIMALPVHTIWNLNLPTIKRVALLGVFLVASFGMVASIVRARVFFSTGAFEDETWASVDLIGWSIIETSVYIITGCLPHLRSLISHYTPQWLKNAVSSTVSNISTKVSSKGLSGLSGSRSFGQQSKKGNITGQDNVADDGHEEIELGVQNKKWKRLNSMENMKSGTGMPRSSDQDVWPRNGPARANVPPVTSIGRSEGHGKTSKSAVNPSSGGITVTREVRMTRS